jgi:hypothetical protein
MSGAPTLVGTVGAGVYSLVDPQELPNAIPFTYYVVAEFVPGSVTPVSDPSDPETITAVNDPPTPILDVVTTNQDTPVSIVVVGNDTDRDTALNSALRVATISNVHGGTAVLQSNGRTVIFTPTPNANSSNTPTGFGFNYTANDGVWSADATVQMSSNSVSGTVSITVTPGRGPRR